MVALLAASALAADLPSGAVRAGAAELAAWAGVVTSRTDASPEDTGTEEARACLPYGASLGVHPDDVLGVEVTAGLREWVTVWGAPSRSLVPEDPVTLELSHVVVAADASLLFTPVSGRLGAEGRLGFDAFLALGSGLVYTVDDVGALAKTADAERLDETAVHPALRAGAGLRLYRGPKVAVRLELKAVSAAAAGRGGRARPLPPHRQRDRAGPRRLPPGPPTPDAVACGEGPWPSP